MKSFFTFFLIVLACGYLFYDRGRYFSYPIRTSLTNSEGNSIVVNVLWLDGHRLQFEKKGDSQLYFYQISDLSMLSRVKLAFFPVSEGGPELYSQFEQVDVRSVHKNGIREEVTKYQQAIDLLTRTMEVSDSTVEQLTSENRIHALELKINKLKDQLLNL